MAADNIKNQDLVLSGREPGTHQETGPEGDGDSQAQGRAEAQHYQNRQTEAMNIVNEMKGDDSMAPLTGNAHILLQYEPVLAVRPVGTSQLNFVRMR